MDHGTPEAEIRIDAACVRRLLRSQHPDFAHLPLRELDAGWDNVMFRLGEDYVVRLPRRQQAVPLIEHEHEWLPLLATGLPVSAPIPIRIGKPDGEYPWPWGIRRWLPGQTADLEPPAASEALRWSDVLRALHRPAPPEAPVNPVRGVPLNARARDVETRFERLQTYSDLVGRDVLDVWQAALEAPSAAEQCWIHGDLHPRNVLVQSGTITALIDWGDLAAGDIATDLASVWMLFDDAKARSSCLDRVGADEAAIARAKGWAVHLGAILLETGLVDHPANAKIGEAALRRVLD